MAGRPMEGETRADLASILPFLPLILRSSSLFWPPKVLDSLRALALGPAVSLVSSGEVFFDFILDLRVSLSLSAEFLNPAAADGYSLFFDELMSRMDSKLWFGEVVPALARLLLTLPALLDAHYRQSDELFGEENSGLRILASQESGIVFLSQELIAALLGCALFCLFPTSNRDQKHFPTINFDCLFAALYLGSKQNHENKVKCLVHYFERISAHTPTGFVSFERKVLPLQQTFNGIVYLEADDWRSSNVSLCPFKVLSLGLIEDQQHEALEVDFANKYLGGGALRRGCVQEEIRFMINPELIAGMLFTTAMEYNEAIEIVGVERFSQYIGYGSSFRFVGDYLDQKASDSLGRKKTRIVAIDALHHPGMKQYETKSLLRETNKAFCGFMDQSKHHFYHKHIQVCGTSSEQAVVNNLENSGSSNSDLVMSIDTKGYQGANSEESIGIATGNWGCGAFGGDPEVKSMIQWLAASQALRHFVHYYTFEEETLERLEEVTKWIMLHGWTTGELWNMLVEYSSQRLRRDTKVGFFDWVLPQLSSACDVQHTSPRV